MVIKRPLSECHYSYERRTADNEFTPTYLTLLITEISMPTRTLSCSEKLQVPRVKGKQRT